MIWAEWVLGKKKRRSRWGRVTIEKPIWSYETACVKMRFDLLPSRQTGSDWDLSANIAYFIGTVALAIDKVTLVSDDHSCLSNLFSSS